MAKGGTGLSFIKSNPAFSKTMLIKLCLRRDPDHYDTAPARTTAVKILKTNKQKQATDPTHHSLAYERLNLMVTEMKFLLDLCRESLMFTARSLRFARGLAMGVMALLSLLILQVSGASRSSMNTLFF